MFNDSVYHFNNKAYLCLLSCLFSSLDVNITAIYLLAKTAGQNGNNCD